MKRIIASFIIIVTLTLCSKGQRMDKITFLKAFKELASNNEKFLEANHKDIFSANPGSFKAKIDSLKDSELNSVRNFQKSNGNRDIDFVDSIKTEIDYKHRRYQLLYPNNFHRYSDLKKQANVPDSYYEKIIEGSFSNPDLLQFQQYIKCMNYYFDLVAARQYKFSNLEFVPLKRIDNRYDAIAESEARQEIKDFFIKEHFNSNIWNYRVEAFDYSYDNALKDVQNNTYLEEIKSTYTIGHERRKDASEIRLYRSIDGIELYAHIFYPDNHTTNQTKPAHLFFHGGGWAIGLPEWSYGACKDAAKDGRVAIAFDYRLRNIHGTDIKASVSDALKAIAWVRENRNELGVKTDKILVDGFSAGGHLALVSAMIDKPKDFGVLSDYSTKPNAIILGSTPYDIAGRDVYNIDYDTKTISPLYLIKNNLPPILTFHGESDNMVHFSEFEKFRDEMLNTNNNFTFRSYPNSGHFYFRGSTQEDSDERKKMTKEFLSKNGYDNE